MKAKPTASIAPPLPRRDDGLAILRREAKREQELAARVKARDDAWQDVLDQRLTLAQADIAERVTAREADGQTAEGLTLADFRHEVTLLGVDRLPSALDRIDGETLLYEGRFNTVYGEAAMGKTWVAIMAAMQALRAGRRVLWWDSEDRATTLAQRLQILKATDLIGTPDLAWVTGDVHESETARADALAFLDFDTYGPGLVVIDSATSFGCPADGADVTAWLQAHVDPWWDAGHTVLLVDHVPKQKKDRPRGGIGSQAKLARIDGAALYAHGVPWNGQQGGHVHLTVHKDRQGQLPATLNATAATVTAEWKGLTLDWSIGLPDASADAENLEDELLEALESVGDAGVKGSRAMRDLLKGKRAKDIDNARDELLQAGIIERTKNGRGYLYTIAK